MTNVQHCFTAPARTGRGRKRSLAVTLPTPETLKRFKETGLSLEPTQELDRKGRPTGLVYNRLTPQIELFLRQGKLSELAHDALRRFVSLADRVHLAGSIGGKSFEPMEYEPGTPDFSAQVEKAADAVRRMGLITRGLVAKWGPFLDWVAPDHAEIPWREQVKIWWPEISRRKQETWFFSRLEELGLILAERQGMINQPRKGRI